MPSRCVVPGCKGNYDNGPKVSVFSFPSDKALGRQWLRAIHRDNFIPTNASKVCELHFAAFDIERETSYYDDRSGKRISVPLEKPRLKKGAVPGILPNCPSYLSVASSSREDPDEKRQRLENEQLETAIRGSLETKANEDSKCTFSSYASFLSCLSSRDIPQVWTIITRDEYSLFAIISAEQGGMIKSSVVVNRELQLTAYVNHKPLKKCGNFILPCTAHNILDVLSILEYVEHFGDANRQDYVVDVLCHVRDILDELQNHVEENEKSTLQFIREQLNLLNVKKNNLRYSPEFLIFSSLVFSISPHAYRFMRHSGNLILPHPSTIKKICANVSVSPVDEQHIFLKYAKEKFCQLEEREKTVTLMVDEIHLKPFYDYKGGTILGAAFNTTDSATSAHVFMIRSLLSNYRDVVHVLPVKTLTAELLFEVLKKVIVGLECIGYHVICVVSDNNSINRKSMTYFSTPPKCSIVYNHPSDQNRPLFFVIDPVHILKCVRNNWLNQHNYGQCMYYPNFESTDHPKIEAASFMTLKKLYELEHSNLLKYGYGLTLKALNPSNLERQNVRLVLRVFSEYVVTALEELGAKHNLQHTHTTSAYIQLILRWWKIVNVKTPHKGSRLRDIYQQPLTLLPTDESAKFLSEFLHWLDIWKEAGCDTGTLSKETHFALAHSTYSLLEMAKYCKEELNFRYFLPGKIQTDLLEERFGKYRMLSGSQYHVSIRQVMESEAKLRLQDTLPLYLQSNAFGKIQIKASQPAEHENTEAQESWEKFLSIDVEENEVGDLLNSVLPIITYLAGYGAYSLLKKLKCNECRHLLVTHEECRSEDMYKLISELDRGGLNYPHTEVVNIVAYTYLIVQKLLSAEYEPEFLKEQNQRLVAKNVAYHVTSNEMISVGACDKHDITFNSRHIISVAVNSLLKNYCTNKNDTLPKPSQKRKLQTLEGKTSSAKKGNDTVPKKSSKEQKLPTLEGKNGDDTVPKKKTMKRKLPTVKGKNL